MTIGIVPLLSIIFILALGFFYLVIRIKDLRSSVDSISSRFPASDELGRQTTESLNRINDKMVGLDEKAGAIRDVIAEVTTLRNLFIMPKGAGAAGERLLEKALHEVLPADSYITQFKLSSGIVDFVIKFKDYKVPIDSKLSLEDFNRILTAQDEQTKRSHWKSFSQAVKRRIDETSKYILPNEGTTDFAIMYIASEGVYYEAFIRPDQFGEENSLMEYAIRKKVYPTSPQTIYPYLVTILQGMKALKIEENAREILDRVSGLRNDFDRFKSIYSIVAGHIENAHSKQINEAQSAMSRIEQHILGLEHKAS